MSVITKKANFGGAFQQTSVIGGTNTTPAVTARLYAMVAALSNAKTIDLAKYPGAVIELMLGQDTNNEVTVQDIFACRGEGQMKKICTLTWTTGQQVSDVSGYLLADTVAISDENWPKAIIDCSPADDRPASVVIDPFGCSKLVIVSTTRPGPCLNFWAPIYL